MKALCFAATLLTCSALAHAEDESEIGGLDETLFAKELWTTSLADLKARFEPEETEEDEDLSEDIKAQLEEKLREQGIDIVIGEEAEDGAFAWLSSEKRGIRAPKGSFTIGEEDIGEVIIRTKDGTNPSDITISLFNRGDDGLIRISEYEERLGEWKQLLTEKLGERPNSRDSRGAVETTGWMWKHDGVAWLLEGSKSRRENRAEFIRLRVAPLNASGTRSSGKMVRRSSLDDNVVKGEGGDVYIKGIPMVDQGDKGYCVVASVERVARYYGAEVDQHELAQLAQTDNSGTSAEDMEKAFKKLTGKIHARTLRHIDFDDRQFEKDFKSYNRIAKREGVWYDERDFDDWYLDPRFFWMKADKEVFRDMKVEQAQYDHFNRKIKEYIDQGIPLAWTLYLGMFKEGDLPQSYGGHMRLIIGYNEEKEEVIYSDSWGEGHGMKKMPAGNAWCMTTGLYSMVPNR
jgi:hypothetical protein